MTDEKMKNEDMVLKLIERIHGLEKQIAVCNSSHKLTEDRLKALEEKHNKNIEDWYQKNNLWSLGNRLARVERSVADCYYKMTLNKLVEESE